MIASDVGQLSHGCQANTIKRIAVTFGLLSAHDFLDKGWGDDQFEQERTLLTDAMLRYTAFHFA